MNKATLRDYQQQARDTILQSLDTHSVAVDASDTGTGKTYTALGVVTARQTDALVVCPKSLIPTWGAVSEQFGVDLPVLNYERLKTGNTPYLRRTKSQFQWMLEPGSLVIFDEAHRCGGVTSLNSKLCALTKAYRLHTLLLSATLADSPTKMRALGYLLGLHNYRNFVTWALQNGCFVNRYRVLEFSRTKAPAVMATLHRTLFPDFGVRVRTADIPGFPENQVDVLMCQVGAPAEIDAAYREMTKQEQETSANKMVVQLRARQRVELVKAPVLVDLAQDFLEEGMSVVVFVNFRDTVDFIYSKLQGSCVHGDQSSTERAANVARFQSNETRTLVCTLGAGGVGLSFHDLHGGHPRISLINPSFNAVEVRQALGRIHRDGSKSSAIQRIVLAAGTVEAKIRPKIAAKFRCLDALNDGDMAP